MATFFLALLDCCRSGQQQNFTLQPLAERFVPTKSYFSCRGPITQSQRRHSQAPCTLEMSPAAHTESRALSPLKPLAEQGFKAITWIKCLRPLKHLPAVQGPPGKAGTPPPDPQRGHKACRLCGLRCFGADEPAAFPSSCLVGSVLLTGSSRAERVVFITCSLLTKLSQA